VARNSSGRRDGRFALVECGKQEAEEMIRTLDAKLSFHLPPAPTSVGACPVPLVFGFRTTDFVGDWWRTENLTTDADEESLIRLNQQREAKERRVRGQCLRLPYNLHIL